MKKASLWVLIWATLCCFSFRTFASDEAIRQFVSNPHFKHASIGFSLVRLSDGAVVASYDEERALAPASTLKVLTTATVLSLLPASDQLRTTVGYRGVITPDGVLQGDLIVRGQGDPSLASKYSTLPTSAFFEAVCASLQKLGIHSIQGRLLADETYLSSQGIPPGWNWEDMGNYYAAGVYGLNYADNTFTLTLNTHPKGQQPRVKHVLPQVDDLVIENGLETYATPFDSAYLYGAPFQTTRFLFGALPHKQATFSIRGDMPEPPLQLIQNLRDFLRHKGFTIDVSCFSARMVEQQGLAFPKDEHLVYTHRGDRLDYLARQTNVYSLNLYAEALLRWVGKDLAVSKGVTNEQGVNRVLAYWKQRGLDTSGLFLQDGSGLSESNRITASFMTGLLYTMQDHPPFVHSLPLVGKEGTVKHFLAQAKYAGIGRIKSGSISQVLAYAGYLTPDYAVAIFVNNATGSTRHTRAAIEKLLMNIELK